MAEPWVAFVASSFINVFVFGLVLQWVPVNMYVGSSRVSVVVKDKFPEAFLGQDSEHLYFSKILLTHTDYAFIGCRVAAHTWIRL